MLRTRSITACAVLIGTLFIGLRLVGMFEEDSVPKDVSGFEFLLALVGFFLVLAGLIAIILLIRQHMRPISGKEVSEWKKFRHGGKQNFVVRGVLRGMLVGLFTITCSAIADYVQVKSLKPMAGFLWIYVGVVLMCVLGALYAALRTWDANESDYVALVPSAARQLQDSPTNDGEED